MCMLTVFPMPDLLDSAAIERLNNGGDCNPHGHGWAVVIGSHVEVGKSLNLDEAVADFEEAYDRATGPALFHSRWATHGAKDLANTHPFPVRKYRDTYLAHNGIMPAESLPGKHDSRSDTRVFADDILPSRFRRLDSAKVRRYLDGWLRGNKVAILTTNRSYRRNLYLFGRELGEWVDGVWYSNGDHEGWSHRYAYTSYTFGTPKDDEPDECEWCHSHAVNAWRICVLCGTCQDCFEPQDVCLCFSGPAKSASESHTPLALEAAPTVRELQPGTLEPVGGWDLS